MPMNTTFVIRRSPPGSHLYPELANSRFASHTCPTISATLRLRLKPCCAVEQNVQSIAQPTWLEMHNVPRPGSGMKTVSIPCVPSIASSHLRVTPVDPCVVLVEGGTPSA